MWLIGLALASLSLASLALQGCKTEGTAAEEGGGGEQGAPCGLPGDVVACWNGPIAVPLVWEYAGGSPNGRRPGKELVHKRDELVANLTREARAAREVRTQKSGL